MVTLNRFDHFHIELYFMILSDFFFYSMSKMKYEENFIILDIFNPKKDIFTINVIRFLPEQR
jgi:hypothetical protein